MDTISLCVRHSVCDLVSTAKTFVWISWNLIQKIVTRSCRVKIGSVIITLYWRVYTNFCFWTFLNDTGCRITILCATKSCEFRKNWCTKIHVSLRGVNNKKTLLSLIIPVRFGYISVQTSTKKKNYLVIVSSVKFERNESRKLQFRGTNRPLSPTFHT